MLTLRQAKVVGIFLFSEAAVTGNTYDRELFVQWNQLWGSSFHEASRMEIYWQKLFHLTCLPMLYLIQYVKQIRNWPSKIQK